MKPTLQDLPQTQDYADIVVHQRPLIDVRAPVEFAKGAFPGAVNLPLMNDEERRLVGICYKEQGQDKAVALGHRLVNEAVRAPRVEAWVSFKQQHPDALLYCFRGGMRSKISQQWMLDLGQTPITRIQGGYKAFRRYLIDQLEAMPGVLQQEVKPLVLAGRTGSGKTQLIQKIPFAVDLEALAEHRGSAFGGHIWRQPSQIDFENRLAYRLIQLHHQGFATWLFEDEGRNIGSLHVSAPLHQAIKQGERILLETPFEQRVAHIFGEYVVQAQAEYGQAEDWRQMMLERFLRIAKRLGGEGYSKIQGEFHQAWLLQSQKGDMSGHESWIVRLLQEYYDPMYDYQLKLHPQPYSFVGSASEVTQYLAQRQGQRAE